MTDPTLIARLQVVHLELGNILAQINAPAVVKAAPTAPAPSQSAEPDGPRSIDEPSCPKCGGRMWDNRMSKRNPKSPDYKCRSRSCDGVIWPPRAPRSEPEYGY